MGFNPLKLGKAAKGHIDNVISNLSKNYSLNSEQTNSLEKYLLSKTVGKGARPVDRQLKSIEKYGNEWVEKQTSPTAKTTPWNSTENFEERSVIEPSAENVPPKKLEPNVFNPGIEQEYNREEYARKIANRNQKEFDNGQLKSIGHNAQIVEKQRINVGKGTYINGSPIPESYIKEGRLLKANGEWFTEEEATKKGITEFQEDLREKYKNNTSSNSSGQKAAEVQAQANRTKPKAGGESDVEKQSGGEYKRKNGGFFSKGDATSAMNRRLMKKAKDGLDIINNGDAEKVGNLLGRTITPEELTKARESGALRSEFGKMIRKERANGPDLMDWADGNKKSLGTTAGVAVGFGAIATVNSNGGRRSNSSLYGSPF